jgi:hypothetical protein
VLASYFGTVTAKMAKRRHGINTSIVNRYGTKQRGRGVGSRRRKQKGRGVVKRKQRGRGTKQRGRGRKLRILKKIFNRVKGPLKSVGRNLLKNIMKGKRGKALAKSTLHKAIKSLGRKNLKY